MSQFIIDMADEKRALYAYSASPDDPNEVSFMKGEILEVVDATGKWFQVRTPAGITGVCIQARISEHFRADIGIRLPPPITLSCFETKMMT